MHHPRFIFPLMVDPSKGIWNGHSRKCLKQAASGMVVPSNFLLLFSCYKVCKTIFRGFLNSKLCLMANLENMVKKIVRSILTQSTLNIILHVLPSSPFSLVLSSGTDDAST